MGPTLLVCIGKKTGYVPKVTVPQAPVPLSNDDLLLSKYKSGGQYSDVSFSLQRRDYTLLSHSSLRSVPEVTVKSLDPHE